MSVSASISYHCHVANVCFYNFILISNIGGYNLQKNSFKYANSNEVTCFFHLNYYATTYCLFYNYDNGKRRT